MQDRVIAVFLNPFKQLELKGAGVAQPGRAPGC